MRLNVLIDLTDELDYLAGRGASLDRLGTPPTLCGLAKAQGDTRQKGLAVRKFLHDELGFVEHPIEFKGRVLSASVAIQGWAMNLDLKDTGFAVPYRRREVLDLLGFWDRSDEWWRKGPEWNFLHLLAEHIVTGNS